MIPVFQSSAETLHTAERYTLHTKYLINNHFVTTEKQL